MRRILLNKGYRLLIRKPDGSLGINFENFSRVPHDDPRAPAPAGGGSFAIDMARGLHSENFSIQGNIEAGDSRSGLADADEIQRIMRRENVSFDTARLLRQQRRFAQSNVDPNTGIPLDPKTVMFSK